MINQQILPPQEFSSPQHPSKFSIGQEVVWAYAEAHDHGTVVGYVWANQTSCTSEYHYLIELAPTSLSYSFCKQDWAFENDIKLLEEYRSIVYVS